MKKYVWMNKINDQLTEISKKIQKKYFPELLPLPATINTRLHQTQARIRIPGLHKNPKIEFRLSVYKSRPLSDIKEIFKHEYIHYQLYKDGKPYGHSREFAKLAHKLRLKECYQFEAKYIQTCTCGRSHWTNKRKELWDKCICGKKMKLRRRKL